jgi:diguanylate cyclase (GGDEF)-like protein
LEDVIKPKPIRVLYVDEDRQRGERLRGALCASACFPLTIMHSSTLEVLEQAGREPFDVVLFSLSPDQDPLSAADAVSTHLPAVPIVTIGGDIALDPVRCIERGIQEHIPRCCASVPRVISCLHWVGERSRTLKQVELIPARSPHVVLHDSLTDLPNRQLFQERLGQLLGQASRRQVSLAVMFLDIDRFKEINDTLGHDTGDVMLIEVARRLQACLRSNDTVARWGGDEFTILLEGIGGAQHAARVADKILERISRPMRISGRELFCSASIGISLFPLDGADQATLMRQADAAMYKAKSAGGGHRFFDSRMHDQAVKRLEVEFALRKALDQGELSLHYQPQIELSENRLVGFEALMRWQHPMLGSIPPAHFIPVAEETALILPLGKWALETACKQISDWQAAGLPAVPVAVNLSPREIQQQGFEDQVEEVLQRTGIDPRYLELELTESALMRDSQRIVKVLARVTALGVRTSIDDFGTGFSSLAELRRFPISRLKIDRSFIDLIPGDNRTAAITRAIIDMAHCLDMRTVAEGVERSEQLELLKQLGCDEAQGFLLAPPVPASEAHDLLRDARLLDFCEG